MFPLPLPTRFVLSAEIRGTRSAIARTRLVGLPLDLGDPTTPLNHTATEEAGAPLGWHKVRLSRAGSGILLDVDGKVVNLSPDSAKLSDWLSIEPPQDATVEFRDLVITW